MTTTKLLEIALVSLAGGEFVMGADDRRRDERPAHVVRVGPFRVAPRPVSNSEYAEFARRTDAPAPPFWSQDGFGIPDAPVVGISWHDASAYCAWLADVTGVPVRQPTEAEREYAARGGIAGADWPDPEESWPDDPIRSDVATFNRPHVPVSSCQNGYGLYCMADNVHEWCADWYSRNFYEVSPSMSPTGPASGTRRASRGGSWRHRIKFTRVSARSSLSPSYRYNDYGFRIYADGP